MTGRFHAGGGVWAVNRARVDLRDKDASYSTRYRERLTLERETPILGLETVPYVSVELLYDTRYDAWSEQRYQVGLEVVLDENWHLEPYYRRQEDQRSEPSHTNVLGMVVKFYR